VVVLDRDRLTFCPPDLDLQALARHDPGLIGAALLPGATATPARFHLATASATLGTTKPT
jgi:hypothetical protein